jgi:hypothetical protein
MNPFVPPAYPSKTKSPFIPSFLMTVTGQYCKVGAKLAQDKANEKKKKNEKQKHHALPSR